MNAIRSTISHRLALLSLIIVFSLIGCTSDSPTSPVNNPPDDNENQGASENEIASLRGEYAMLEAPSMLTADLNCQCREISRACRTVELTWRDNSTHEAGFIIERVNLNDHIFHEIAKVGSNATSFTDCGLTPKTFYYYRIKAFCGGMCSGYSNITVVKTGDDGFDPKPPQ